MSSPHYTTTEMRARFMPLAPTEGSYRIKEEVDGGQHLQLRDDATAKWRTLFLTNGAPQLGPAED